MSQIQEWKNILMTLCVIVVLAGVILWRVTLESRPQVIPENGPSAEFSAERALKHLTVIAAEPHPVGSPRQSIVRNYIQEKLRLMGIRPEIQETETLRTLIPRVHTGAHVHNIVAVIPGVKKESVLFLGHYDSVPTGPGAGDDGTSVSSFLETIRALKGGEPPLNTLIFLFSDGEESGLIGAKSFLDKHPLIPQVKAVFDFESRGISGESILFQTGKDSGALVSDYLKVSPNPYGNSLGSAIYDLLPNDTDFTVFKKKDFKGLDFAFIDGVYAYHTSLDRPENVDSRTIQHHGENILGLAKFYSRADLEHLSGPDLVFFNITAGVMARYTTFIAHIFAIVAMALLLLLIYRFKSRGLIDSRNFLTALFAVLMMLLTAGGSGFVFWQLLQHILKEPFSVLGQPYNYDYYGKMFVFLPILFIVIGRLTILQTIQATAIQLAALVFFAILLVITEFFAPGASFIFLWPLLFGIISLALNESLTLSIIRFILLLILTIPILILGTDLTTAIFKGLTIRAGMVGSVCVMLFGLCAFWLFDWLLKEKVLIVSIVAFGFVFSILGIVTSRNGGPTLNSLAYSYEFNTNRAIYFSCDREPDSFTKSFFKMAAEKDLIPAFPVLKQCLTGEMFLLGVAPRQKFDPPELTAVSEVHGTDKITKVRIRSPRGATGLVISVRDAAGLKGIRMLGLNLALEQTPTGGKKGLTFLEKYLNLKDWHTILFNGLTESGITMEITSDKDAKMEVRVTDRSRTIEGMRGVGTRPAGMIAQPEFPFSDGIYLSRSFQF